MNPLASILGVLIDKKRIVGWAAAVGLFIGAAVLGMQTKDFKDAVCGASIIEQPGAKSEPTSTPAP